MCLIFISRQCISRQCILQRSSKRLLAPQVRQVSWSSSSEEYLLSVDILLFYSIFATILISSGTCQSVLVDTVSATMKNDFFLFLFGFLFRVFCFFFFGVETELEYLLRYSFNIAVAILSIRKTYRVFYLQLHVISRN